MTWQPIDFQRIVTLDKGLVEQLQRYLLEKESELIEVILNSVPLSPAAPNILPIGRVLHLKLSDAVESFSKRARQWSQQDSTWAFTEESWQAFVKEINRAFWDYYEVLEGCIRELFLQIDQLGVEQWGSDISTVLDSLKDLLLHCIEDLLWAAKRMESRLGELRHAIVFKGGKASFLRRLFQFNTPSLDPALLTNLQKSERFLIDNYERYALRFQEYIALDQKVRETMKKLENYSILKTLEEDAQDKYKKLYYYLKLWMRDPKFKTLPSQDLIRALQYLITTQGALDLFKNYMNSIRSALFFQSRLVKKSNLKDLQGSIGQKAILDVIKGYRSELLSLGSTVVRYRDFLLRTDPNPYIRSRWGFTEWVTGSESDQSRQLMNIEYELENLGALFTLFEESISSGPMMRTWTKPVQIEPEIQRALYEMGQPLTSHGIAKSRADRILKHLQNMDELGSFYEEVVEYGELLLSRVLRADWKYHVVNEIPLYFELYGIHVGVMGILDDRKHLNRLNKFKHLISEIETWVKNHETRKHERDIELDMNDLKGYLQDFLAQVQRIQKEEAVEPATVKIMVQEFSYELLMYRHMFGLFFYHLTRNSSDEGVRIRNKLLFVDQYFESIDNQLDQIRDDLSRR